MTLGELYLANDNYQVMTMLVLVDEDFNIIDGGIEAYLADYFYGNREVSRFKGCVVTLRNLKEEETNE